MTMVTGLFLNLSSAENEVRQLVEQGVPLSDISMVYRDTMREASFARAASNNPAQDESGSAPDHGSETEAQVPLDLPGLVFHSWMLPDVGPAIIAGGMLSIALGGPASGNPRDYRTLPSEGLEYTLNTMGFSEGLARANTETVRRGKVLVLVGADTQEASDRIHTHLREAGAFNTGTTDQDQHCAVPEATLPRD